MTVDLLSADDLRSVLSKGEVELFRALLPQEAPKPAKSTAATRQDAQRRAIESFDLDRLLAIQEVCESLIDTITANELGAGEVVLSGDKASALMGEFLDEREVEDLLKARKEMIRETVFAHLDETAGVGQNGSINVPEKGKRFVREGCGDPVPAVDEQRLQALLGNRWIDACVEEIVPAQVIPERIEYTLSIEKVLELGRKDHSVLEALRSCLVPGKPKSPRFTVRDL